MHDDVTRWSACDLRKAIGTRQLSPVDVVEACPIKIEALNPYLNAITAMCFSRARQEARRAEAAVLAGEELGALHGLPIGIKGMEEAQGLLSTYGSPLFRNHIPARDNALATDMLPLCAGTDTGGSLRIPAAVSGEASQDAGEGTLSAAADR